MLSPTIPAMFQTSLGFWRLTRSSALTDRPAAADIVAWACQNTNSSTLFANALGLGQACPFNNLTLDCLDPLFVLMGLCF